MKTIIKSRPVPRSDNPKQRIHYKTIVKQYNNEDIKSNKNNSSGESSEESSKEESLESIESNSKESSEDTIDKGAEIGKLDLSLLKRVSTQK